MKPPSNNVTRMLESAGVAFQVFQTPEEKLGAQGTAAVLGVESARVFKTIVARRTGPGKKILAVIPGDRELDLKLLAQALGEKKVILPTQKEAEQMTGLLAGGISPLALINKGFEVVIDEDAWMWPSIHLSAGQRGLNLRLAPDDLLTLVRGRKAGLTLKGEEL